VFDQQMANNGGGRAKSAGSSSIILTYAGIFHAGASFEAFHKKSDFVYAPVCVCVCVCVNENN